MNVKTNELLIFARNLPNSRLGKEEFVNFITSLEKFDGFNFENELEKQMADQIPEVKEIYREYLAIGDTDHDE